MSSDPASIARSSAAELRADSRRREPVIAKADATLASFFEMFADELDAHSLTERQVTIEAELAINLTTAIADADEFAKEVAVTEARIAARDEMHEELRVAERRAERLSLRTDELTAEVEELRRQVAEKRHQIQTIQANAQAEIEAINKETEETLKQLKKQIDTDVLTIATLKTATAKVANVERRILAEKGRFEAQLADLESQLTQARSEQSADLERHLAEREKDAATIRKQEARIAKLIEAFDPQERALMQLQEDIKRKDRAIHEGQQATERLKVSYEAQCARLADEIDVHRAQVERAQAAADSVTRDHESADSEEVAQLKAELAAERARTLEAEAEAVQIRSESRAAAARAADEERAAIIGTLCGEGTAGAQLIKLAKQYGISAEGDQPEFLMEAAIKLALEELSGQKRRGACPLQGIEDHGGAGSGE